MAEVVDPAEGPPGVVLYRPVGAEELRLIEASGFRGFPPRLDHQPIFYPVVQAAYAHEIAKQWNAEHPTSQGVGFVTIFRVRAEFLSKYEKHSAGGTAREEYWIPAAELAEFNRNIIGRIEVIAKYERAAR
jgi:hypothetical protein